VAIKNLIFDALEGMAKGARPVVATAITKKLDPDTDPAQVAAFIQFWLAKDLSLPASPDGFLHHLQNWQAKPNTMAGLRAKHGKTLDEVLKAFSPFLEKAFKSYDSPDTAKLALLSVLCELSATTTQTIMSDSLETAHNAHKLDSAPYVRAIIENMIKKAGGPVQLFAPSLLPPALRAALDDPNLIAYLDSRFGDYARADHQEVRVVINRYLKSKQ